MQAIGARSRPAAFGSKAARLKSLESPSSGGSPASDASAFKAMMDVFTIWSTGKKRAPGTFPNSKGNKTEGFSVNAKDRVAILFPIFSSYFRESRRLSLTETIKRRK